MVTALTRKLLRDLVALRGQAVTIALVVACGIASYVTLQTAADSLYTLRARYYESHRFADVFCTLTRAPESLARRLEGLDGVAEVHDRLVESVLLPMPDLPDPALGTIIGLPEGGEAPLDAVYLRAGRMPQPERADETLVLESFAKAHALAPGDTVPAVLDGVRYDLRVVGIALSPEFIFAVAGGEGLHDDARYGVLWMDRDALAAKYRMKGAFDDVLVRLQPGASERGVEEAMDRLLAPYGGRGAHGRDRQASHAVLDGELKQLSTYATIIPVFFLGVAAFLLNVVLARLVHLQRGQIATLKAVGYSDRQVGAHYFALITIIVLAGSIAGAALGALLGDGLTHEYAQFFRFPAFGYHAATSTFATAIAVSFAAAFVGGFTAVLRVVRLPPAEAMRPESPASYRPSLLERLGLGRLLDPAGKMVLRELTRRPLRTWLSAVGIGMALGIMVASRFAYDALDAFLDLQFETAHREDLTVSFRDTMPARAARSIARFPGVLTTEPLRVVPVRIRAGARWRDVSLTGHPLDPDLMRVVAYPLRAPPIPDEGLMITDVLARLLDVRPGDRVEVEVLDGDRRTRVLPIASTVSDLFGLQAHASLATVHRMLDEEDVVDAVLLETDPEEDAALQRRLAEVPQVASVTRRRGLIDRFREQSGTMWTTTFVLTIFAATIAVGVVYNDARIALSLRSRDLASLRVLGFTRAEISSVLLGELAAYVVLAVPIGIAFGLWMVRIVVGAADPETYRLPPAVSLQTFAFALTVTAAAALASALLVRRQLDRLDLVAVLKTRE